jgi:DNA repair protein RecO (recombination protein O)
MLFKTKGIVLNYIKFKESSIIVKIFTARFGVQSYLVNGVRSAKSKQKMALFLPLTQLDLVVYKNNKKDIQRISEFKTLVNYSSLFYNHYKTSISFFLTEILSKTLSPEEDQEDLFAFISNSLVIFDEQEETKSLNFHLLFLMNYSFHLGIYADADELLKQVENWLPYTVEEKEFTKKGLKTIEHITIQSCDDFTLNARERKLCLYALLVFFQKNYSSLENIKSYEVLKDLYAN